MPIYPTPHLRISVKMFYKGKQITSKEYDENPDIKMSLPSLFEFNSIYQATLIKAGNSLKNFVLEVSENGINVLEY
jgi:hypothetical protein